MHFGYKLLINSIHKTREPSKNRLTNLEYLHETNEAKLIRKN